MQTLDPLFDQIVVRPLAQDEMRPSGLVIPATARDHHPPYRGIVVAVGPGLDWWEATGVEMPVKPGDQIMYPWNHGILITLDEEELVVLRVVSVMGVIREVKQPPDAFASAAEERRWAAGG